MINKKNLLKRNIAYFNARFSRNNVNFRVNGDRIIALGDTYEYKSMLKGYNFRWDGMNKVWYLPKKEWLKKDYSRFYTGKPYQSVKATNKQILYYIEKVKTPFLAKLLKKMLIQGKYRNIYFKAPGAKSYHHAYAGGLAEHSLQMLKIVLKEYRIFNYLDLNRDILIAAALLHDIGKIQCYELTSSGVETTKYIKDFDHIVLGISMVSRAAEDLIENAQDQAHFEHLIQIITSHHNIQEWGSPKPPGSHEAWMIHTADQLTSKVAGGEKLMPKYRRKKTRKKKPKKELDNFSN